MHIERELWGLNMQTRRRTVRARAGSDDVEHRPRRQNCDVLAGDRRASTGCTFDAPAASLVDLLDVVSRTDGSSEFLESYPDAVTSSENAATNGGGRGHSAVDTTTLLLRSILAQLRYITADMRRHGKSAQVKDE